MTVFLLIVILICVGLLVALLLKNKKLEISVNEMKQQSEQVRQYHEAETKRIYQEAQTAVGDTQKLVDQQLEQLTNETERIRQHYETETRKMQAAAEALVAKTIKDFEPLRKYEGFLDAELEAKRQLTEALQEADNLRSEAQALLEHARNASAEERSQAVQKAKEIRSQVDALLNQAIRDAGRIVADAEKRAEQIG